MRSVRPTRRTVQTSVLEILEQITVQQDLSMHTVLWYVVP
jgi:hypothetical protein